MSDEHADEAPRSVWETMPAWRVVALAIGFFVLTILVEIYEHMKWVIDRVK